MNTAMMENQLQTTPKRIHAQKYALWMALGSIMMMFAAFSSAYVVRRAAGNWLEFQLPDLFFINSLILVASSFTLHASYHFFKKGNALLYRGLLALTFVMGLAFIVMQYFAWQQLVGIGLPLDGPVSGSFIYVISGVHAAHVVGGLGALTVAVLHAFLLPFKVTPRRKLRFELVWTYWHFVDFLWLYLLGFFLLQA